MLKKEINEMLRQSLYLGIFIACLPLLLLAGSRVFFTPVSYFQVLFPVFQVGLVVFALITGISLFSAERKQDGIEYLLTLPMSRLKLLTVKIMPRLTALIFFSLLYGLLFLATGGGESAELTYALPAGIFLLTVFSLFITAVSFSAFFHNFLLSAMLALVVFSVYAATFSIFLRKALLYLAMGYTDYFPPGPVIIFWLVLPLPLLFSFIFSFKKFDSGPGKTFNKVYLKLFIPFLVCGLLLSVVYLYSVKKPDYKEYYLTKEHSLVEETPFATHIYDKDGPHKLETAEFPSFILEHGDYLYINFLYNRGKILSINKKNYRVDTIFSGKKMRTMYLIWRFENTMAFLGAPRETKDWSLFLVHLETKAVKELKLKDGVPEDFFLPWLIGADMSAGERFWLIYGGKVRQYHVVKLWEDGKIEPLLRSRTRSAYFNRMLITSDDEGLVFSKITQAGVELIKKLPEGRRVSTITFTRTNLDNLPLKEMYGTSAMNRRVLRIDLETFQTNWINIDSSYIRYFFPDSYYYINGDIDKKENRFYMNTLSRLKDGRIILLKDFRPVKAYHDFIPSKWGFAVELDGNVKVYTLPDCEELTFKGLNK